MLNRIAILILTVATLLTLGRVCSFGFTNAEDEALITKNPNLNPPTLTGLANHWRHPHIGLYIPVTYTAWWLLARSAQTSIPDESGATLNPWLFHTANLLLHIACALLVLSILHRRLKFPAGPALIGALLFALHPIQVEAVAWTTGMKDVLSGVLALAAIDQYFARDNHSRAHYIAATELFILAMLAKPAAVVLPFMVVTIDLFFLQRPWKSAFRAAVLWFVLTIPILLITRIVQPAADVVGVPLLDRPFVAADALAFYLSKLLWPFNLTMAYARSPQDIIADHQILWTWLAPALVALIVLKLRRPWLTTASLLFVAGLLPVLGLTKFTFQQFSTVADRYLYLSMLGVALFAAHIATQKWNLRTIALCTALLILLAARSFSQAGTWSDRETLYRHATLAAPNSAVAHANLAVVLMHRDDLTDAAPHAARAVQLQPQNPGYRKTYATLLNAQQRWPELITQLDALMKLAAPTDDTAQWLTEAREHAAKPGPSGPGLTTAP